MTNGHIYDQEERLLSSGRVDTHCITILKKLPKGSATGTMCVYCLKHHSDWFTECSIKNTMSYIITQDII